MEAAKEVAADIVGFRYTLIHPKTTRRGIGKGDVYGDGRGSGCYNGNGNGRKGDLGDGRGDPYGPSIIWMVSYGAK